MDQRGSNDQRRNINFLPPGQIPPPPDDTSNEAWQQDDYHFPKPFEVSPAQATGDQCPHQWQPTRRGQYRHSNMPTHEHSRSDSRSNAHIAHQAPDTSTRTTSIDPTDYTSFASTQPHSSVDYFAPHANHSDPSLLAFSDLPVTHHSGSSLLDSFNHNPWTPTYLFSPSLYAPLSQQQSSSSQSPFLPSHTPITPYAPTPRAQYQDHSLLPSHIPSCGDEQYPDNFDISPFSQNEFHQNPSIPTPSTILPIHGRRSAHHNVLSSSGHRHSPSGNLRRPSNFLTPHTLHSRHSSKDSGRGRRRNRSRSQLSTASSGDLSEQRPLPTEPFALPPPFPETRNLAINPHRDSNPAHAEEEPVGPEDLDLELERLERYEIEKEQERAKLKEKIEAISKRINSRAVAGKKDYSRATKLDSAERTKLYTEWKELDKETLSAFGRLAELREWRKGRLQAGR